MSIKLSLYFNENAGPSCPVDWQARRQSCYFVNDTVSITYSEALSACNDIGGTLTSVLDQDEQNFLIGESAI